MMVSVMPALPLRYRKVWVMLSRITSRIPGITVATKQPRTEVLLAQAKRIISMEGGIRMPSTPEEAISAPIRPSG